MVCWRLKRTVRDWLTKDDWHEKLNFIGLSGVLRLGLLSNLHKIIIFHIFKKELEV
jgi:hypothetical protein